MNRLHTATRASSEPILVYAQAADILRANSCWLVFLVTRFTV